MRCWLRSSEREGVVRKHQIPNITDVQSRYLEATQPSLSLCSSSIAGSDIFVCTDITLGCCVFWNMLRIHKSLCEILQALWIFLPAFQFPESITVSFCWASGMTIAKLNVRAFKNIFHFRECEISCLVHFNPLNVPFIPVWVSAASCKMRNNTDPRTLRKEQLSNFSPERTYIFVSNTRSMLYHFQDPMKLLWILPWLLEVLGLLQAFGIMEI